MNNLINIKELSGYNFEVIPWENDEGGQINKYYIASLPKEMIPFAKKINLRALCFMKMNFPNGQKQDFYLRNNEDGSENWYPFFGFDKNGFLIRGDNEHESSYYKNDVLKAVSYILDMYNDDFKKMNTCFTTFKDFEKDFQNIDFIKDYNNGLIFVVTNNTLVEYGLKVTKYLNVDDIRKPKIEKNNIIKINVVKKSSNALSDVYKKYANGNSMIECIKIPQEKGSEKGRFNYVKHGNDIIRLYKIMNSKGQAIEYALEMESSGKKDVFGNINYNKYEYFLLQKGTKKPNKDSILAIVDIIKESRRIKVNNVFNSNNYLPR